MLVPWQYISERAPEPQKARLRPRRTSASVPLGQEKDMFIQHPLERASKRLSRCIGPQVVVSFLGFHSVPGAHPSRDHKRKVLK